MEQFIGLRVPAGESFIDLRYFPPARATVFLFSIGLEIAVGAACIVLATRRGRVNPPRA
jgi:hypothetical protein